MALTPRQRAFVAAYDGNATAAARAAGYAHPRVDGCRLMKKPEIREAIDLRDEEAALLRAKRRADALDAEEAPHILTREERKQQLSKIALDPHEKTCDRLRAIELLGRSEGDYLDRLEHSAAADDFAEVLKRARERAVGLRYNINVVDPYAPTEKLLPAVELDVTDAELVEEDAA